MKRIALFMMLAAMLAVHTGCRASSTCCNQQPCCPIQMQDDDMQAPVPVPAPEGPTAETARRWINDDEGECVGGACIYDPALPPVPVLDQEA